MASNKYKKNVPPPKSSIVRKPIDAKPDFVAKSSKGYLYLLACLVITGLVYLNTLENEFVNWDDDRNFYENANITTLTKDNFWDNTKKIFTTGVIGNYNPLTTWSFLLDHKWYGLDNPAKWHRTNVLLHLIGTFFVFLIGRSWGLGMIATVFFTLAWSIHPLRVESVAWVTERKDVLFGAFFLAALYQYTRWKQGGSRLLWIGIYICFILSLLAKIQAVALPLTFLCVDYWLDKEIRWSNVIRKIPLFAMSLLIGLVGIHFLTQEGSLDTNTNTYAMWQRPFVGTYSYMVYLIKSIVPYRMSPLYPYPDKMPAYFYPTILLVPAIIFGLWKAFKKKMHIWVFGAFFFTFNIVFLLQVLGAGQGFLADRFTYISILGLNFVMAWYADNYLFDKKWGLVVKGLMATLIAIYGFMTINQNKIWKNSGTLWTHVIQYYENTTLPFGNRANYYRGKKQFALALQDYNRTIAIKPEPQTYNSRARLFFEITQSNRDTLLLALSDYNKAIELKPNDGEFLTNRGATHARLGDVQSAISDLNEAIRIKPDHAVAYLNRSLMFNATGNLQGAKDDLMKYLTLNPYNSDIQYEVGRLNIELRQNSEALPYINRAIELNASKGIYYSLRAQCYANLGNMAASKQDVISAEQLNQPVNAQLKQTIGM